MANSSAHSRFGGKSHVLEPIEELVLLTIRRVDVLRCVCVRVDQSVSLTSTGREIGRSAVSRQPGRSPCEPCKN